MFPLMCVMQTPTYPPVPVAADRSGFGRGIQRTMTLLETSRPKHRNTVRILFYGQSITEQDWSRQVAEWLRAKYPNANLIIENRAIGGHSTQLLWRTSEADLYPFQPDLMILSVLGSHIDYETIIRNVLQKTVAEVLVQTDHITRDEDVPTRYAADADHVELVGLVESDLPARPGEALPEPQAVGSARAVAALFGRKPSQAEGVDR